MITVTKVKTVLNKVLQLTYSLLLIAILTANSLANELESKIETAFKEGQLKGLHAVYVLHKGNVVAESYFTGHDEIWGDSVGIRKFDAASLHDIRSITKSIVSILYGIALSEDLVPDTENSLLAQFPQYQDLVDDPDRQKISIHHALSMMMGVQWDESAPYTSVKNSEIAMERAPDRYRYALDRSMINAPGENWVYNGGATTLIGQIIAQGTGKSIDEYAEEKLFSPLGITHFEWSKGSDGTPSAAAGLRMKASDLAKIGLMLINNGLYENTQIVPPSWLKRSFTAYTTTTENKLRYGYFWWLSPADDPLIWVEGSGIGGQSLDLVKSSEYVSVIFAGNYNQPEAWKIPVKLLTEIISPILFPE